MTTTAATEEHARRETPLDAGWRFYLGDNERALDPELDDRDWEDVRLPHDWAIGCPTDPEMEQGRAQGFRRRAHVGWYRRRIALRPVAGRRWRLQLDGAYRHAEVWINGRSLGVRPSGYATRIHDITEHLQPGDDQLLAVRCDNTGDDADRWYCGAGLYRRVWLIETGDVAIAPWGIWITTPRVSDNEARVEVRVTVQNSRQQRVGARLYGAVLDAAGESAATIEDDVEIPAGGEETVVLAVGIAAPQLWSPESPTLYALQLQLTVDGTPADQVVESFGLRSFSFDAEHGFRLNGTARTMKGVCLHHDLGCLGSAFFAAGWERRLRQLKEIGCDAVRTSHNIPAAGFLDLCDRLGILVIDEAFDKWWEGCSGEYFEDWWQRDIEALVCRDRNHPCVIVWSIGNEVEEQGSPRMLETSQMLADYVRELDPTRPTLVALRPHENDAELWASPPETKAAIVKQVADTVDIVGLNYQDQWYDIYHETMPDRVFIATEAFHFYQHRDNGSWAFHAANPWFEVDRCPFVAGQFLWTGIEYLGEASQGWPNRGWKGAPIDIAGFIKPRGWWHAAAWRPDPIVRAMVHFRENDSWEPPDWSFPPLQDHWNLPARECEMVEVWVFSNGHTVELLLNGGPQGTRDMAACNNRIAVFHVPYSKGVLTAISRDADGNETARHELQTASEPARLELSVDRDELRADGQDLAHITITVVDENGVRVPHADPPISVEVQGAARLIGLDNGDLLCHEPYSSNRWHAYRGRCLAVLRAGHTPGPITVTAIAPGLPSSSCRHTLKSLSIQSN